MSTALAKRRYRIGVSLFLGSGRWLRWPLLLWAVGAPIASVLFINVVETGLWTITATVFQWFVAVTAGGWVYTNLPTLISRGVTRREITVAYIIFGILGSIAVATLTTVGFAAEHALLDLFGDPLGTWGGDLANGARYFLITPIYFFTGAFIGASAMRFGGRPWFVVVLIIAASGHYAGVLFLEFGYFTDPRSLLVWAAMALGVIAILVAASSATLRSVPIQAKRA
ncbi:hypothetical protein [Glycomyces harbinensis]|uniref:PrsW family intramembrane metalloprotease n=1 Tax=Glycomyces harbinensis TaxID=58114 RepID=A0A1G6WPN0_9ACTN|nr:hypothetical protein [Glycomyces harbinensis]SDD67900.1 hypothetical protein SAMN05216270_106153 [Glycomyces harbinensis]